MEIFPSEYHISDGKGGVISQSIELVAAHCSFTTRQAVVTFSEAVRRKMSRLTSKPLRAYQAQYLATIWPKLNSKPFI